MKKALLGTFVTLLVMAALVSCDDVVGGSGGKYLPDGQMVTVNIVTDMGRSITETIAKDSWNYYEVIFRETATGPYHRGYGLKALGLTITLPAKTYTQANTLLLLGTNSGRTLVATGRLSGANVNIASVSGAITFTVDAVEASLIATDSSLSLGGAGDDDGTYEDYDCFQTPINGVTTGSLTFEGFDDTFASVFIKSTPLLEFYDVADNDLTPIGFSGSISPATGAVLATGVFSLSFTGPAVAGTYKGIIDIPVVGFDATVVPNYTPITWHLRGGTVSALADLEGDGNEGFVLVVYDPSEPKSVTIGVGGF
jgi:hypothetical protein